MHVRDIIEQNLSPSDAEQFAEWAWGPTFRVVALTSDKPINLRNNLHGDKLTISVMGSPLDDIPLMIDLWKLEKDQT